MRKLIISLSCAAAVGVAAFVGATGHAAPEAAPAAPAATAAAATAPAKAAPAAGSKIAFEDMTKEQKGKFMKTVITPKMKGVFQAFDPVKFKEFNCATCHGKDAKERKFQMPGNDVRHLPGTPAAFQAMMAKEPTWPKWVEFMKEKVMPPMGEMLGEKLFDPKNPAAGGFGCMACHQIDKS
jgi:hypothetical protein